MPPPSSNWRMNPTPHEQRSQNNSGLGSQQSSTGTDGLVAVYIHPARLRDIEAAFRYLGLPPLSDLGNDQDQAPPHRDDINHSTQPQFKRIDAVQPERHQPAGRTGRSSPQDGSDYLDLSASFSRLSTSTKPTGSVQVPSTPLQVRHSPAIHPNSSPRKNKRYYVVMVGKCTGVFWDEWDQILPLVSRVSGARYKNFSTRAEALAFYSNAKRNHLVSVVRDPGDDLLFGPSCDAMQ